MLTRSVGFSVDIFGLLRFVQDSLETEYKQLQKSALFMCIYYQIKK